MNDTEDSRPGAAASGRRVSVVIPAYNEASHITAGVTGVGTYLPVLVVDDGSTDNSASVASEFAEKCERVSVLSQPNGGEASARNLGMWMGLRALISMGPRSSMVSRQTSYQWWNIRSISSTGEAA